MIINSIQLDNKLIETSNELYIQLNIIQNGNQTQC